MRTMFQPGCARLIAVTVGFALTMITYKVGGSSFPSCSNE